MHAPLKPEQTAVLQHSRIARLERELVALRTQGMVRQGTKGATLAVTLGAEAAAVFAPLLGLPEGSELTVGVKFSKLNTPVAGSATRRWNWSKPLGWKNKGQHVDVLVLVGEKDPRYPDQYVDEAPYVFFVIPRARVPEIMTQGRTIGANVQITTHLARALSPASTALKQFLVPATAVSALLDGARAR